MGLSEALYSAFFHSLSLGYKLCYMASLTVFFKVSKVSKVAQSCPTLCDPMDCSLSGSSIHGIFQARVVEWGAVAFSAVVLSTPFSYNGC